MAALAFLFLLVPGTSVLAGNLVGTIYDADTGEPLQQIDLDLYDTNFGPVYGIDDPGTPTDAISAADGTYGFDPIAAGSYYLRADPTKAQGYVVQYAPGVFLASDAIPVVVRETGTTTVDFYLERGHTVRGRVVDAATLQPVSGIDLDLYAGDRTFVDWINATSDANGEFSLGLVPNGAFYVGADPELSTMYLDTYSGDAATLEDAQSVEVLGEDFMDLEIRLSQGGIIAGSCQNGSTGAFLGNMDLKVYDASGNRLRQFDSKTDGAGGFWIGLLEVGTYYIKADATAPQGVLDTWFGNVQDQSGATPVNVVPGQLMSGLSIVMPPGGTVGGLVTNAETGEPLANVQMSLWDEAGHQIATAKTSADGTYLVGAVAEAPYVVRCAGVPSAGLPFQYHTGALIAADAEPVQVLAGSTTAGIDFPLTPGGWISGSIMSRMGEAFPGVDLDLYSTAGERIGEIDADTDESGAYTLGPMPAGEYLVYAKFDACGERFYGGSKVIGTACVIEVSSGNTMTGIDFTCGGIERVTPRRTTHELSASPNPFNPMTRIAFNLDARGPVRVTLFDVRGRIIATLVDGTLPAGHHEYLWDGRGVSGETSSSGVHFVRLETARGVEKHKLILLK